MIVQTALLFVSLLLTGIEAAYVPTDDGGGEYLVRVEPDLVRGDGAAGRGPSPFHFATSAA